jgi:two-component sensor histidine kinase
MSLNTDKHHLWLGYRSDGIKRINLETGKEKNFSTTSAPSNALRSNAISSIEPDANGDAWITTFGGGAARYDRASDKIINYTHNVSAKNSDQVMTFYEDKSGTVWLGSSAGLSNLDSASHSLVRATPQSTDIELGESTITAIHGDQSGNIWIGTEYEGLAVWPASHRAKGEMYIRKARTNRRMPSSTIYAIEEDNNGFLWISTSNGLVRLDPGSMTIITFDYRDGLQDNEFNFGASFKDSNGFLYFGGNRGFNRFDPESIVIDAKPPQVVLTSATFADTRLGFDESYVQIDSLDLDYKDYFATFSFSALDYKEHSQIEYKYKLDNFDQDWVSIGNKQSIGFTNLPSGVYTLNIKASGTDGQWSDTGLKISLLMHPPPWLDWWAFSIYGALLVGLMALVRKYYDTYALKERADQMALDMELTAENALDNLQEQISNEQQLARNIHTHTSGMLNLLGQVFEQNGKFFNDPEITEVLLANQDRVQCLKHVEDNLHYLGDTLVVDFRCFAERMFDSLDKYDFGPTLQVVPVNDIIDISLPAQVAVPLSLIINEMFHNSLKHAYRDLSGVHTFMVCVKNDQKATGWQVEVSDSGCGLPESINPLMPITSGMVLIAYCATLLDAAIEVQSDKGTVFRMFVPRPAEEDYASTY